MAKESENLRELLKIEALITIFTFLFVIFIISALPILLNNIIGYERTLFSVPGVSINFPTLPALNPSLSQPIMLWSSIGIFVMVIIIGIIYEIFATSDPKTVHSFIYSEKASFIFGVYIFSAGFLLFIGLLHGVMLGPNTVVDLSFLVVFGVVALMLVINEIGHSTNISSKEEKTDKKNKNNTKWRRDKKGRPYAICPKCHSKIYYLEAEELIGATFRYHIVAPNDNGELSCYQWFNENNKPGKEDIFGDCSYLDYFKCPKCLQTIADNYEEAKALFQKKQKEGITSKK